MKKTYEVIMHYSGKDYVQKIGTLEECIAELDRLEAVYESDGTAYINRNDKKHLWDGFNEKEYEVRIMKKYGEKDAETWLKEVNYKAIR